MNQGLCCDGMNKLSCVNQLKPITGRIVANGISVLATTNLASPPFKGIATRMANPFLKSARGDTLIVNECVSQLDQASPPSIRCILPHFENRFAPKTLAVQYLSFLGCSSL